MAQEDQMCSSSGSGSGGKGPKKKTKAPQRGLGVAQLEKIISEEQHKKAQPPSSSSSSSHNVTQQRAYSELLSPHKDDNSRSNNPIWPFNPLVQRTPPPPPQYQLPYTSMVSIIHHFLALDLNLDFDVLKNL